MLDSRYEHNSIITERVETDFVHSVINSESRVLEYGSGRSTVDLALIAKSVVSLEHQEAWYNELKPTLPENVELMLAEPDLDYIEGPHDKQRSEGNDGTYEEFESYIKSPLSKGPFDVVIIDGRARVECAKICKDICHEESHIFVHDFERKEYEPIMDVLECTGSIGRMFRFKLK